MSKREALTDDATIINNASLDQFTADSSSHINKKAKRSEPSVFLRMLEGALLTYNSTDNREGYFDAILRGSMQEFDELIKCNVAECDDFWGSIGYSLLGNAAEAGLVNVAQVLLKYEKDDARFIAERSKLLYWPCYYQRVEAIKLLLEHRDFDPNVMVEDPDGYLMTCLNVASKEEKHAVVEFLLMNGADPNLLDSFNDSPLIWACYNNKIDTVRVLLDHGADINAIGRYGDTPLTLAVQRLPSHSENVIQLLLERGADPMIANESGRTALDFVTDKGSEIAQLITNAQLQRVLK